jgi:hypothetical protein
VTGEAVFVTLHVDVIVGRVVLGDVHERRANGFVIDAAWVALAAVADPVATARWAECVESPIAVRVQADRTVLFGFRHLIFPFHHLTYGGFFLRFFGQFRARRRSEVVQLLVRHPQESAIPLVEFGRLMLGYRHCGLLDLAD